MENRLAPYPDHIPFHASLQAIVEDDSPFLREKRSEFLLNAVLNFPRTMPKKEFFSDLAALIPDAEAACEICAGAFAAEKRDAHGRLPRQTCFDLPAEDDEEDVDEADTLLSCAGANRLNDALDGSRCVRLWIANLAPSDLPVSNLRRFDLAIPFEPLGPRQRAMIWRNSLARNRIGGLLGDEAVADFAERYPVSGGGPSRRRPRESARQP